MDIEVPIEMRDLWHCYYGESARVIQCFEPNRVVEENGPIEEVDHFLLVVEVAKVTGLPRGDHTVVRAPDQHHPLQLEYSVSEARGIVRANLIVDVGQKV